MDSVIWMDFSGAPPLVLPAAWRGYWHGFYLPLAPEEDDTRADLELPDGRCYVADTHFDFERPRTDYDRLCAAPWAGHFLYPVGPGQALAISDYSDGVVGWWPEEQMILTVSQYVPPRRHLAELDWTGALRWTIPPGPLFLINSCLHGVALELEDQYVEIKMAPGRYLVESAEYEIDYCLMLYRFQRLTQP